MAAATADSLILVGVGVVALLHASAAVGQHPAQDSHSEPFLAPFPESIASTGVLFRNDDHVDAVPGPVLAPTAVPFYDLFQADLDFEQLIYCDADFSADPVVNTSTETLRRPVQAGSSEMSGQQHRNPIMMGLPGRSDPISELLESDYRRLFSDDDDEYVNDPSRDQTDFSGPVLNPAPSCIRSGCRQPSSLTALEFRQHRDPAARPSDDLILRNAISTGGSRFASIPLFPEPEPGWAESVQPSGRDQGHARQVPVLQDHSAGTGGIAPIDSVSETISTSAAPLDVRASRASEGVVHPTSIHIDLDVIALIAKAICDWNPDTELCGERDIVLPFSGNWEHLIPLECDPDLMLPFGALQMKAVAALFLPGSDPVATGALTPRHWTSLRSMLICFWLHCDRRLDLFAERFNRLPVASFHLHCCDGGPDCDWIDRHISPFTGQTPEIALRLARLIRKLVANPEHMQQLGGQTLLRFAVAWAHHIVVDVTSDVPVAFQQMGTVAQLYLDNFGPGSRRRLLQRRAQRSFAALMICFWLHCELNLDVFVERHPTVPFVTFHDLHCSGRAVCDWEKRTRMREENARKWRERHPRRCEVLRLL